MSFTVKLKRPAHKSQGQKLRFGFIGVGAIGLPMVIRALDHFSVTLWSRNARSVDIPELSRAMIAGSPAELAACSDIVALCITGDADALDLMLRGDGILSGMRPGGIVVIHATVSVATISTLAEKSAARGVALLDAPVSGGPTGAREGRLTIMVGGAPGDYEASLPVLRTYGRLIPLLGPLGSGQKMKLLNNMLGFSNLGAAAIAFDVAERLGLERDAVSSVLEASSGASYMLGTLLACAADPALAASSARLMAKDEDLARKMCLAAGLSLGPLNVLGQTAVECLQSIADQQ